MKAYIILKIIIYQEFWNFCVALFSQVSRILLSCEIKFLRKCCHATSLCCPHGSFAKIFSQNNWNCHYYKNVATRKFSSREPLQQGVAIYAAAIMEYSLAIRQLISSMQGALLPGYMDIISDVLSRKRYTDKLEFIGGQDPYELPRSSWINDVDKWPSTTYIHVRIGMYLAFSPSPYTGEDLLNYKSLNCF